MQCSEESVVNIAILSECCDISQYFGISQFIKKFDIFQRYDTIYRYGKRYMDIFDISSHH